MQCPGASSAGAGAYQGAGSPGEWRAFPPWTVPWHTLRGGLRGPGHEPAAGVYAPRRSHYRGYARPLDGPHAAGHRPDRAGSVRGAGRGGPDAGHRLCRGHRLHPPPHPSFPPNPGFLCYHTRSDKEAGATVSERAVLGPHWRGRRARGACKADLLRGGGEGPNFRSRRAPAATGDHQPSPGIPPDEGGRRQAGGLPPAPWLRRPGHPRRHDPGPPG